MLNKMSCITFNNLIIILLLGLHRLKYIWYKLPFARLFLIISNLMITTYYKYTISIISNYGGKVIVFFFSLKAAMASIKI